MTPQIPIDRFEVFAAGLDHPECVAFDRSSNLYAGGEAGQIYRIDRQGKVELIAEIGGFTGGLAFSPRGWLIACNPAHGLVRFETTGRWSVFATHAGTHKMMCPNFPVFDRHGNLYVTDSGQWKKQNGYLLRFSADGAGEVVAGPFGYANGLALSADEKRLFMVESNTDRIFEFPLDVHGSIGEARVMAESVGRLPDGLALDTAGTLYVCCYASDEILTISPDGKRTQLAFDHHAILISRPTNIAFGGDDMDEIYVANLGRQTVTRAKIGITGQKLANQL
jgi:gluconolactonase